MGTDFLHQLVIASVPALCRDGVPIINATTGVSPALRNTPKLVRPKHVGLHALHFLEGRRASPRKAQRPGPARAKLTIVLWVPQLRAAQS